MPNLGAPELIIIAIVLLVLFGGAKLAGLGKSTGRALREFKEETKGLRDGDDKESDDKAKADGAKADQAKADDAARTEPARKNDEPRELTQGQSDVSEAESFDSEESRRNP